MGSNRQDLSPAGLVEVVEVSDASAWIASGGAGHVSGARLPAGAGMTAR
jgi:hypothetical protein